MEIWSNAQSSVNHSNSVLSGFWSCGDREAMALTDEGDKSASHPLAEVLACPPAVDELLHREAQLLSAKEGEFVFRQTEACKGLYVLLTGSFLRRMERLDRTLFLGQALPGEMLELGAVLSGEAHSYSLFAKSDGAMLLLPIEAMREALASYPPLRMHLLEEFAREVSHVYGVGRELRSASKRHRL